MEEFIAVNVRGTVNVLDAAEAAGAERVVHLSSVVVYGYADEGDQDESASPPRRWASPTSTRRAPRTGIAVRRGAVVIRPGRRLRARIGPVADAPGRAAPRRARWPCPARATGRCSPSTSTTWSRRSCSALRRGEPGPRLHRLGRRAGRASTTTSAGSPRSRAASPPRKLPRPVLSAVAGATELVARLAVGRRTSAATASPWSTGAGTASNAPRPRGARLGAGGGPRRGPAPQRRMASRQGK